MKLIRIALIFCFIGCPVLLTAQPALSTKSKKAVSLYQEAIASANQRAYDKAIILLKEAIKEDNGFIEANIMLGEVYIDNHQDSLAIVTLKQAIQLNPDFFPAIYSNLANVEFINGLYQDALVNVNKYLAYPATSPKFRKEAELLLKSCEFAIKAMKNPVPFHPQNLGPNINSKYDQYWPSLSADEQTMVFTEELPKDPTLPMRKGVNSQEDFYCSTFENNEWLPAKPIGPPINTSANEGAQTISADGTLIIFTECPSGRFCDLYFSKKEGDRWTVPQSMGPPINSPASEKQPSLSSDGKTLYFVSTRPGGKGGLDIWKSTLSDEGYWGDPVNLGDSINTPFDDQSPFIHPDNQTLYFSSSGWPGLGRFDLFVSHRTGENQWTTPKNLGYPINTNYEDKGLIVNARGNMAYYSSDRLGGLGGDDIYSFELYKEARPTPVSYMKGRVFNAETHQPLLARFELIDLASAKNIMDAFSNDDGTFLICIPSGKDYALNVNKKGYLFYSDNFTMSHGNFSEPFLKDVPLKPIKVGEKVVMKNIFFDSDSYVLKDESKVELNRLIKFLKENPMLQIEISGHTDNTGKPDYNLKLSESRAGAVVNYMVQQGIDVKRMTSKGYGSAQPIAPNDNISNRAQNRRTEFMVMKVQ